MVKESGCNLVVKFGTASQKKKKILLKAKKHIRNHARIHTHTHTQFPGFMGTFIDIAY